MNVPPSRTTSRQTNSVAVFAAALSARFGRILVPALPWVSISVFLCVTIAFSVNVPVGDDYVVLDQVVDLRQAASQRDFLETLFAPHSEHRIVLTRALAYLASFLPGGVDFRLVQLTASVGLICALVTLGRTLQLHLSSSEWAILFLVVLQPQQLDLWFYPMAALQAYFGLLFAALYLNSVIGSAPRTHSTLALLGAALTTGGWIVLPVVGAIVFSIRRQWSEMLFQACTGFAIGIAYFSAGLTLLPGAVPYAAHHPLQTARLFVAVLGNFAELPTYRGHLFSTYTTVAFGCLLFGYFLKRNWGIRRRCVKTSSDSDLAFLAVGSYAVLSVALVAVNRIGLYHEKWLEAALDGRYRVYGLVMFAVIAIEVVRRLEANERFYRLPWTAILAAAIFASNVGWYAYSLESIYAVAHRREQGLRNWLLTGDPSSLPSWVAKRELGGRMLERAVEAGIFRPQ